jgi:hypothetical protein
MRRRILSVTAVSILSVIYVYIASKLHGVSDDFISVRVLLKLFFNKSLEIGIPYKCSITHNRECISYRS